MITKVITARGGELVVEEGGRVRPVATLYGLSGDAKPIDVLRNADRFLEMDTGDLYLYDEAGRRWLLQ